MMNNVFNRYATPEGDFSRCSISDCTRPSVIAPWLALVVLPGILGLLLTPSPRLAPSGPAYSSAKLLPMILSLACASPVRGMQRFLNSFHARTFQNGFYGAAGGGQQPIVGIITRYAENRQQRRCVFSMRNAVIVAQSYNLASKVAPKKGATDRSLSLISPPEASSRRRLAPISAPPMRLSLACRDTVNSASANSGKALS